MYTYYAYTIRNHIFYCIYNPRNPEEVTLPSGNALIRAVNILLLVIFLLVITAFQLVCMCAKYGCRYIFTPRVPEAIKDEIRKQKMEQNEKMLFCPESIVSICQSAPEIRSTEIHPILLYTRKTSTGPAQPLFCTVLAQPEQEPFMLSPFDQGQTAESALSLPPVIIPRVNLVSPSSETSRIDIKFT